MELEKGELNSKEVKEKKAKLVAANHAAARKLLLSLSISLATPTEVKSIERIPYVVSSI